MSGRWADSSRRSILPPDWPAIRLAILTRDGHRCIWLANHDDGGPSVYLAGGYDPGQRCPSTATDVDHVGDPADHRPNNLRALCGWHHDRRSSQQGNNTRAALRAQLRLPAEQHPGLSPPVTIRHNAM
jgi:5-methylcytosine-specific restriction protein A